VTHKAGGNKTQEGHLEEGVTGTGVTTQKTQDLEAPHILKGTDVGLNTQNKAISYKYVCGVRYGGICL
jgi:hypothetical protein